MVIVENATLAPAMCAVPVRGKDGFVFAKVDQADYDEVSKHSWCLIHGYAARNSSREGGGRTTTYMARQILGLVPGDGLQADHINRDQLDNRRQNLRAVTQAQNAQNQKSNGGTSRYRGVYWSKLHSKWRPSCRHNGKRYYCGLFDDEDEAGRAAVALRRRLMPYANDEEI